MLSELLLEDEISDFRYGGDMYEDIIVELRNNDRKLVGITPTSPRMNIILRDEILKIFKKLTAIKTVDDDIIRVLSRSLRLADFINYELKLKDRSKIGQLAVEIWRFYYAKDISLVENPDIMRMVSNISIFPPSIIDFINIYRPGLLLSMNELTNIRTLSLYAIKNPDVHEYPMSLCGLATIGLIFNYSGRSSMDDLINKIRSEYCQVTEDSYNQCINLIHSNYQCSSGNNHILRNI